MLFEIMVLLRVKCGCFKDFVKCLMCGCFNVLKIL